MAVSNTAVGRWALGEPRARLSRLTGRDAFWAHLFLLPTYVGLFGLVFGPVVAGFFISFTRWDIVSPPTYIGLRNYQLLFDPSGERFVQSLWNTVYYVVGVVPPSVVLPLLLAVAVNRIRAQTLVRTVYFLPTVCAGVSIAILWAWLYNTQFGFLNWLLSWFGLPKVPWLSDTTWAMPAVIIMSVWRGLGYPMVLYLAGLQGIPEEYYEAAKIDGAGGWQVFRHVTIPLISPTSFFILVLSIIGSFQVFEQTYIMTQGGPSFSTMTIVLLLFNRGFYDFRMGLASAMAYVLFAIILVFTFVQFQLQRRWVHYEI
jgi:multiple sugar transport system permease protein